MKSEDRARSGRARRSRSTVALYWSAVCRRLLWPRVALGGAAVEPVGERAAEPCPVCGGQAWREVGRFERGQAVPVRGPGEAGDSS